MLPVSWYTERCRLFPGCLVMDQSGRTWRVVTGPFLQAGQVRVRAVLAGNPAVWSDLPAECLTVTDTVPHELVVPPDVVMPGVVGTERLGPSPR